MQKITKNDVIIFNVQVVELQIIKPEPHDGGDRAVTCGVTRKHHGRTKAAKNLAWK